MATIAFNAIKTIWSAGRAVTFLPRQVLLPACAFFLPALPSPSSSSTSTFSTSSSKRSDNPPKVEREMVILRTINESLVRQVHNTHMMHALDFGQPFVIDLGVDYQMDNSEGRVFLDQMKATYGINRSHWEPFNIFLCNYNPRNVLQRKLVEKNENRLWNVKRRCFTDVFPKEKIVYLSSQSRRPLTNFSHDAVYIVGGTVDKRPGKDEMTKIEEMGLNHAYFDLGSCFSKKATGSIPINLIMRALLDQRDTPNLPWAFRHFARRRFIYRERAMNRIIRETESLWGNKRSLLTPQVHDLSKYDLMSEEEFEVSRARDKYDDDGPNHRHNGCEDFDDTRSNRLPRNDVNDGRPFTEEELTAVKRDFILDL